MKYIDMNVQQRAEYLLAKGVEAKLDIDPETLAPGYSAHAIGVGKLPCGYRASKQEAIDAGTAWLRSKAMPHNVELSGARRASDSNAGLDDAVRYWLCCGSKVYPHGAESCYEARAGHPERVRWGTAKEHSEWQKKKSSNAELRGRPLADGPA